jgi:uncharacterized GH25 family protein
MQTNKTVVFVGFRRVHRSVDRSWRTTTFAWLVFVVLAVPSFGHDFWIEPSSFRPAPGDSVGLGLRVGEGFKGEVRARDSAKMDRFMFVAPDGKSAPVPGDEGAEPAGTVKIDQNGLYVIGYRSKRSSIELEPAKFEAYLREEGLERIIALRAERGESDKPGKEVYSRAAKAMLRAGTSAAGGHDRPLGLTFEIVPRRNPYELRAAGDELAVLFLLEGKPAAGVHAFAMNQSHPSDLLSAVTDRDGVCTFRLARAGVWMIKAIHMAPAPPDTQADWESLWATLTFEIAP